jgi:hypothetical protein
MSEQKQSRTVMAAGGRDFIVSEEGPPVDRVETASPLIPPDKPSITSAMWAEQADRQGDGASNRFAAMVNASEARAIEDERKRLYGPNEPDDFDSAYFRVAGQAPLAGLRMRALEPAVKATDGIRAALKLSNAFRQNTPEYGAELDRVRLMTVTAASAGLAIVDAARGEVAKRWPKPIVPVPAGKAAEIRDELASQLREGDIVRALALAEDAATFKLGIEGHVAVSSLRGNIARLTNRKYAAPFGERIAALVAQIDRTDPYALALAEYRGAQQVYAEERAAAINALRDWTSDPASGPNPVA